MVMWSDESDEIIKRAKDFLKKNKFQQETEEPENFFVNKNGDLVRCPQGMYYDYKAESLKFKKVK
jgi:hypothetical protein